MKRGREDEQKTLDLINCLMLLSKVDHNDSSSIKKQKTSSPGFVCKTCNREFSTFQALGGHRASHNKPGAAERVQLAPTIRSTAKVNKHECPICGLQFGLGQALGGHMRKHRDDVESAAEQIRAAAVPVLKKTNRRDVMDSAAERIRAAALPVLKKSNSCKRMSCLNLDLSLAPPGY